MDSPRMVVRSLGASGSIERIEERMRGNGSDGLDIVDADGTIHRFDGEHLSDAKLERTSDGWLWTCIREGRETVFQEGVEGLVAIGATELESKDGRNRRIVLEIDKRAEDASLDALVALLGDLAEDRVETLALQGEGIARLLLAIDVHLRFETLEITHPDLELDVFLLSGFRRHLQWLTLKKCGISCGGLASITAMKRLTALVLDDVGVPEQEFAHLSKLPKLDTLWLFGRRLGVDTMSQIARCSGLTDLWIRVEDVETGALRELSRLSLLRELVLDCPDVDDADVPFLLGLSDLDHLDVTRTGITNIGLRCLRKHLPDLGKLVPVSRAEEEKDLYRLLHDKRVFRDIDLRNHPSCVAIDLRRRDTP